MPEWQLCPCSLINNQLWGLKPMLKLLHLFEALAFVFYIIESRRGLHEKPLRAAMSPRRWETLSLKKLNNCLIRRGSHASHSCRAVKTPSGRRMHHPATSINKGRKYAVKTKSTGLIFYPYHHCIIRKFALSLCPTFFSAISCYYLCASKKNCSAEQGDS